jgi:hypothetical protein
MESFLKNALKVDVRAIMDSCGKRGVDALSSATPLESGRASQSWGYETSAKNGVYSIVWTNTDVENGFPVVIMLQYGYGTGTGGYVEGVDFINPAIKPIFNEIADKVWRAVISG